MEKHMAFDLAQTYTEAFTKAYPQKKVEVKRKFGKDGQFRGFNVIIDGEDGSHRLLTTNEMHEAIRNFNR